MGAIESRTTDCTDCTELEAESTAITVISLVPSMRVIVAVKLPFVCGTGWPLIVIVALGPSIVPVNV